MDKLSLEFYRNRNVLEVAYSLLGKTLVVRDNKTIYRAKIVETEAYNGVVDKASHAYGGRYTTRTKTMYLEGGHAYVYLCYGIHNLFNVVTGREGQPQAVLIRAVEPLAGISQMLINRDLSTPVPRMTSGPGAFTQAVNITRNDNGISLLADRIWIENAEEIPYESIVSTSRIGVDYAGQDALLPYRYYIRDNPYVSKPLKQNI